VEIELDYAPHHYQELFHLDTSRFRLIVGGRRVGKTHACISEVIKHCLEQENRLVFWVAPSYKEAREIGFETFMLFQEALKPAIESIHHTQCKITFINGSCIYFKGSDNPDSLRGRGLTLVIFDECAFGRDIWGKVLRPSLSDRKGRAVLLSTPNGYNWFHKLYQDSDSWSKYKWISELNPLMDEVEINAAKEQSSEIEYKQEYLAEFITSAGQVYSDFNEHNIIEDFTYSDKYSIYIGMDFGYANPSALCFFAVNISGNQVICFDEVYIARKQLDYIIQKMYATLGKHGIKRKDLKAIYCDPAGNADELVSGISPVDVLRMDPHNLTVINKGSKINPGLALVRSWIKNANGKRRFLVTKNCTETIRSFYGYTYTTNKDDTPKDEPLKDGIHDHAVDAVRYFFVNQFDSSKYVANKVTQEPYGLQLINKRPEQCAECRKRYITRKEYPPYICNTCIEILEAA